MDTIVHGGYWLGGEISVLHGHRVRGGQVGVTEIRGGNVVVAVEVAVVHRSRGPHVAVGLCVGVATSAAVAVGLACVVGLCVGVATVVVDDSESVLGVIATIVSVDTEGILGCGVAVGDASAVTTVAVGIWS
jgi:hypothetical protein